MTQSTDPNMFEVGDVVQLRSGGPLMTINELGEHKLSTAWFTRDYEPRFGSFRPAMLRKVAMS